MRNDGDHVVISFDRVDIFMTFDEIIAPGRFWLVPANTILSPSDSSGVDKLPMMQPVHTENNNSALDMESLEEMLRKVM